MPSPSAFEILYTSESGRKVYENCGVPFIFAKKEDTWISIAKEFRIFSFQVFRQNDMQESDAIIPGQMIYLESKKKKNADKTYKVKTGDSMYSISQEKCVKLSHLLKYNKLKSGEEPRPGFDLKLAR
jgi:spore germination protein YaaH